MFQIWSKNEPKKDPQRDPEVYQNGLRERAMFQTLPGGAREAQNLIKQMKNTLRNLSGKKDGKRNVISKCALVWLHRA
mgnify:CR=1 FL=1